MKQVALLLLLSFTAAAINAQQLTSQTKHPVDKLSARFSPLALADFLDGNLSLGAEYRLNKTIAVTMDAGWIFYSHFAARAWHTKGVILRPAIRLYVWDNLFLDLQFHYKNVIYDVQDSLQHTMSSGGVTMVDTSFKFERTVKGLHVMVGYKWPLDNKQRLWLELYAGLGVHFKWQQYYRDPNSIYANEHNLFRISNFNGGWTPAFPAGVRILYRFK